MSAKDAEKLAEILLPYYDMLYRMRLLSVTSGNLYLKTEFESEVVRTIDDIKSLYMRKGDE